MSSTDFTDEDMAQIEINRQATIKMRVDAGLSPFPDSIYGDVREVLKLMQQLKEFENDQV